MLVSHKVIRLESSNFNSIRSVITRFRRQWGAREEGDLE
jgi:hypothetical protein